jgi:monoterpene epsilon-lactone hydrolase
VIAEVIGRDVRANRLDPDVLGKEAEALRPMFAHYDRRGLVGSSLTLRSILGRAHRTLRAYFEELARKEIRHALSDNDRRAVAAIHAAVAPLEGTMSGPDARASFDDVMEHTPDAPGVRYETSRLSGVPGIWCTLDGTDRKAAILHLHGGAYVLGSARAYRHFAGQIADRSNASVFIAQYRLAPEHPFPAALDDARAAYRGLVESGARTIAILGDSAGGGLALALLAVLASENVAPLAARVMSPWTDFALTGDSLEDRPDEDPLLTKEMLSKAAASYLRGHEPRDPLASPLYGDLAGRPPTQLHLGTSEFLLDDSRRYAERARSAGVEVSLHIWEGMTHVFASSVGTLEAAETALILMGSFIGAKLGTRPLPTPSQVALPGSQRMTAMTSSIFQTYSITTTRTEKKL